MGSPVVHWEVMGKDADALRKFYASMFDWNFDVDNPLGYGMVAPDQNRSPEDRGIGGGIGAMPEGQPGYSTFYVGVDDVEGALQRAEQLGGSRVMGPEQPMEGLEIGMFTDPEGNAVGLVKVPT
jgi:predicted enzyme related to lactoylglutathione lyase